MNMKYALSSILLCFSLFCLPSCNDNETPANTPDGEEVEEVIKSYDWQLEGKWEYALNNGNDFSRTLVFEKDGKGSYDDGTLEWYCSNNHLYIDFDNGKSIKDCDYLFYGATLQLKNPQLSYILDCPFIGSWLATDAHNHFTGSTFYYTFAADGNAECFTFNTSGIWESQKYSWLRTQDGIQLLSNMANKNLICEADAEKLTIQGDGDFSHTSPFYGKWKSVYSQDGIIDEKDENFSTIELYQRTDDDYFVYYEKDNKYASFQGPMSILLPNRALLINPADGSDPLFLYFRFYYSKDSEKVYLELSKDNSFTEYTRYEFVTTL